MFIENDRWQPKNCLRARAVLPLAALLCLVSHPLSATDLFVDCGAQPDGISQALATPDVVGPLRILVSGACMESVFISDRDRVTIEGVTIGASINDVTITSARSIVLSNLVIANGLGLPIDIGVSIRNSEVELLNCTIEFSTRDGVRISHNSHVTIEDTTIRDNGANGLVIESDSSVATGFGGATNITNNSFSFSLGSAGIQVNNGSLLVGGNLTVDSNGRDGLNLGMGSRVTIGSGDSSNSFSNNARQGVSVHTGSTIIVSGDNTIANNGRNGVLVFEGGTARFIFGRAVIEGNARWGVFAALDSGVRFLLGTHQIRFNGVPEFGGGVLVSNNSSFLAQTGTDISNNTGVGVTVDIDASASFQGVTINNNSEQGVLLSHIAVAEFFLGQPAALTTISSNGTADLACDDTSLAFGDLTGIVVNTCKELVKEKKDK